MNTRGAMQLFLTGIIVLAVFARILQAIVKRTKNRQAVPVVVGILVFMFLCFVGTLFFLMRDMDDSGLVLYAALMLSSVALLGWLLYFCVTHFRQTNKRALALFLTYLLALLFITLFSRDGTSNSTAIRMDVLSNLEEALSTHSITPVRHMILNIALFIPLGFLFPMVHEELQSWLSLVTTGMMLSTIIETIQLFSGLGECDINDILANTLGTLFGYFVFSLVRRRVR